MDKELVEEVSAEAGRTIDAWMKSGAKDHKPPLSEVIAQAIIPIVLERAAKASRNAITCGDYGARGFEEIAASDSEKAIRNLGASQ